MTKDDSVEFQSRNREQVKKMNEDDEFKKLSKSWMEKSLKYEYSYHFTWLGIPIIQYTPDIIAAQEIVWNIKPDLIIETGIARGGSMIFYSSLLEMIGKGEVLGIDIDIREHNRSRIENHPLFKRITMIEGSSIDENIINQVQDIAKGKERILLILDSNHSHEHVLKELEAYSPLIKKGGYIIVADSIVEDMPEDFYDEVVKRPWGIGNNPKTAAIQFLKNNKRFEVDEEIENKLMISTNPNGYLKCVS